MAEPPSPKKASPQLNVRIAEDKQCGRYANKVIVAHSREEFILDFIADFPPQGSVVSRIITTPAHAAALLDALTDNLTRFERRYGAIKRGSARGAVDSPTADA